MAETDDWVKELELPSLKPTKIARHFGPGLILMMTGIGTSHLITAPVAGGRFGFALLWCIPIAYVFKYYGFEMAFRFTHGTGRSMLDAYSTAPGKWPVWYVLITTVLQCALGQAGRLVAAAAVLYYFFAQYLGLNVSITTSALILGVLSVTIILLGRYAVIELMTKILAGLLVATSLLVYAVKPAPLSSFVHFFQLETSEGSWLVVAAFLGLLPTGIDVSLQASEWGKAKGVGLGRIRPHLEKMGLAPHFDPFAPSIDDLRVDTSRIPDRAMDYCRRWFRIALWDFRHGHLISFVLACLFLLLAAVWLYPSPVEGREVIGEIAQIFTLSVGPWMMSVFLLGAFAATFSTAFNYFDGWPRVVSACCRNLFRPTARLSGTVRNNLDHECRTTWYSEYNVYRGTMLYSLVASVAIIAGIQRPVWLVLVASALALFVAPVVFFLNLYYCFAALPKSEPLFYPSRFATWFGWLSFVVFTGLTVIVVSDRVFGLKLFGG